MPLDIDVNKNEYNVSVQLLRVPELLASLHMLAEKHHHSFDTNWVKNTMDSISSDSKSLLERLSALNFPGLELFDFMAEERIYDDIPLFINKLKKYDSLDFLHIILDKEFDKDQLSKAKNDEAAFNLLTSNIPWVLQGSIDFFKYIVKEPKDYQDKIIKLMEEIYIAGFEEKLTEQMPRYENSMEALKQRLIGRDPVEVGEEIKGSKFKSRHNYSQYLFTPSYFFHHHNIISYDESVYLMIYNINIDNSFNDGEAERLSELLKVLSDKTRLEILRQLKMRSTYGKILATRLNLTTATISRHLDQLKSINLIKEDKSSNVKYYYVDSDEVEKLFDEIRRFLNRNIP